MSDLATLISSRASEVRQLRIDPSVPSVTQKVASMVWVLVVSTHALNFPRTGGVSSDLYG